MSAKVYVGALKVGVVCRVTPQRWYAVWQLEGRTGYGVGHFRNRRNAKAAVLKRHSAELAKTTGRTITNPTTGEES